MLNDNKQFFEFVTELQRELKALGRADLVQRLATASSLSTVPGETLGQLRIEMIEIVNSNLLLPLHINKKMVNAISYLNEIL